MINEARALAVCGIGFVILVFVAAVHVSHEGRIDSQQARVASFTVRLVAPHVQSRFVPFLTETQVGNYLIWVACMQPNDTCAEHACLRYAMGDNATAVEALCAAVTHDCPSDRCVVSRECRAEITGAPFLSLFALPCSGDPCATVQCNDYAYADKIVGESEQ